jgi:hypothetical protein
MRLLAKTLGQHLDQRPLFGSGGERLQSADERSEEQRQSFAIFGHGASILQTV